MKRIFINSKNGVVTINGGVTGAGLKQRITVYALATRGVKRVINNLNAITIKCGPCEIPCAGGCISQCLYCNRKTPPKCKPGEYLYHNTCVPKDKVFEECPDCPNIKNKKPGTN